SQLDRRPLDRSTLLCLIGVGLADLVGVPSAGSKGGIALD
ncbi:MAG: hypothetical protein ACI9R3_005948, partial [Verrucomicrobiales bacterium]